MNNLLTAILISSFCGFAAVGAPPTDLPQAQIIVRDTYDITRSEAAPADVTPAPSQPPAQPRPEPPKPPEPPVEAPNKARPGCPACP